MERVAAGRGRSCGSCARGAYWGARVVWGASCVFFSPKSPQPRLSACFLSQCPVGRSPDILSFPQDLIWAISLTQKWSRAGKVVLAFFAKVGFQYFHFFVQLMLSNNFFDPLSTKLFGIASPFWAFVLRAVGISFFCRFWID